MTRARRDGKLKEPTLGSERPALGQRIRAARLSAGIGLREISRRIGCSPGLISKIEHDSVAPSVSTLYAIARELQVPIGALLVIEDGTSGNGDHLKDDSPSYDLVRAREGRVRLPQGVVWRRLAAGDNRVIEFREIIYQSGATSGGTAEMLQHPGHEHGTVVEGRLSLQIGRDILELSPGDSIAFDAQRPHRFWNRRRETARAIWIVHANYANGDTHL